MRILLKFFIVFTALTAVPLSYAQYDLNGNGTIDLPLTLVDGEQLRWFGQDLTTDEVFQLGLFGHPSYQVGIGRWISVNTINRVYVSKNQYGDFELYVDNRTDGYQLGQSQDDATVIIGRDIDSSGLLDAVLINGERSKWAWKLSFNPLSDHSNKRRILYGKKRFIPFLFRARGDYDSLGLLQVRGKRSKITYRPLNGRRKRRVRLRGFSPSAQQPRLIRGKNGRDSFSFVEGQKFLTVNSRGRTSGIGVDIPQNGSILIGDFDSDGIDSVVTFAEGKIFFTDGEVKRLSDQNVKPITSNSEKSYQGDDVSLITTPTSTIVILPTNTVAPTQTIQLTYTLFPTVTPVPTRTSISSPTVTLSPTPPNTATVTPTVTHTYTSIPTQTPQFTYTPVPPAATYTPYPTFTATFTPTATGTATPIPTPVITGTPPANSVIRTDCNAHRNAGETTDGVYWVDPDGSGAGLDPMRTYCDMTTDGGGWTLIMNYLHEGGTDPALSERAYNLPLQSNASYGSDDSTTEGGVYWGHAVPVLLNKISFTDIRFYCRQSSEIVDFKTSNSGCLHFFRTGIGRCDNSISYSILPGQNGAELPAIIDSTPSGSFTLNPFGYQNTARWEISNPGSDWSCDSQSSGSGNNTHHQIWIR